MMIKHETTTRIAALACLAALLSGCGGEDAKEEKPRNNCLNNILSLVDCVINSSDSNGSQSGKPNSGVASTAAMSFGEYEPNNVLANANFMTLPIHTTNSHDAAIVRGSVSRGEDESDFFVFTPPQSGSYRFSVCEGICEGAAEDDAVYIMIYDQSQTTIAGTPVGTVSAQDMSAELTAGMAYYVEVNGYNADAFAYDYRLTVARN